MENEGTTFWDHLDVLRSVIIRIIIAVVVCGLLAFIFKDELFLVLLAPKDSSFITYSLLGVEQFTVHLVNVGLTEQFMVHMKAAIAVGFMCASPYIIYVLYGFIAPALYENEQRYASRIVTSGYLMFIIGILVNYFLVFPLTVRFLGTYSVSADVENMLSLASYMDTMLMMCLVFGVIFEIPVVSYLLGKAGLLKASWMSNYRRHAIVVILIIAAVITPTSDMFTLLIVSLPIWLLYEISILLVRRAEKSDQQH